MRPVVLSRSKVDVVIGNPPWINYNQTADILRDELLNLSRNSLTVSGPEDATLPTRTWLDCSLPAALTCT